MVYKEEKGYQGFKSGTLFVSIRTISNVQRLIGRWRVQDSDFSGKEDSNNALNCIKVV